MLDLYTIDGSCSNGVRDLLRYLGADYAEKPRSAHRAELERLNPAASVPTLGTAFGPLTESGAILVHLASTLNGDHLLGRDEGQRARVLEMLFFLNSTVYFAFIPWFRPEKYARSEAGKAEAKQAALEQIGAAAHRLKAMTASDRYLVGDALTVCDFIGLVYLDWLAKVSPEILESAGLASHRLALQSEILGTGERAAAAI